MKNKLSLIIFLLAAALCQTGCKKGNYPGGAVSPYLGIFDLRALYKGTDITLNEDNMYGCSKLTGVVTSDHSGGNLPANLLIMQDSRRLGKIRGIALSVGDEATKYVPGDSIIVDIVGAVLKRENGTLQVSNVKSGAISKVASGKSIPVNKVTENAILANPDAYESTFVAIVKAGFNPLPSPEDVLSGNKIINDGFGNITLHTEAKASFASTPLPVLANYYGIIFTTTGENGALVPQQRLRTIKDLAVLSSTIEIAPVVISGFMADLQGADGNYEYIQLMATRDINFAATPFSVFVTNNANASTPTGYPANGWATGGLRTYKFNLTSGTAKKGTFFYVGGTGLMINGANSTSMASSNWIRSFNYSTTNGDDGVGTKTSGLFANSGNASGVAVFQGTQVNAATKPVDVIFVATGGSLFTAGPPAVGYRITNNDWYDVKNPITLTDQPFYSSGTNTLHLDYTTPADAGFFNQLGGEYNPALGRWTKARKQNNILLTKSSLLTEIEGETSTKIK
ncbi:hypothetical protein GS399_01835 [Pedobacter sp. HMF7647]|uniref:DUF5689 domain-containing protein n=1 Tax=Hufsiella arboris TaxID=2695275 RepID=A0A7K1Y531_9SPHI|nr:DUF5689 domain-containing protein [Hufsiella arboris]MXV49697.1 hypothetical protein [Hufsiella arboris]